MFSAISSPANRLFEIRAGIDGTNGVYVLNVPKQEFARSHQRAAAWPKKELLKRLLRQLARFGWVVRHEATGGTMGVLAPAPIGQVSLSWLSIRVQEILYKDGRLLLREVAEAEIGL